MLTFKQNKFEWALEITMEIFNGEVCNFLMAKYFLLSQFNMQSQL